VLFRSIIMFGTEIKYFESLNSTNQFVVDNAEQLSHGAVVYAALQTHGRGRHGRKWQSENNQNLYCTFLLKDLTVLEKITHLPILFALSCYNAITVMSGADRHSKTIGIKWPNDIISLLQGNSGKLCGILIEGTGCFYAIGIGINIMTSPVINGVHTSSIKQLVNNSKSDSFTFSGYRHYLEILLNSVNDVFQAYKEHGFNKLKNEWEKSCYHINKDVIIDNNFEVRFLGLNNEGAARVVDKDGAEKNLYYGEISAGK
jgi:BirA family transcriptional regulator, biotin operon repressor / biotin---[acetyl-CoA-carboxylase] ligase